VYEAFEVDGSTIVACCEASKVLEAIEAALDAVSLSVGDCVMRDQDFARAVRRDDRLGSKLLDQLAQGIAVIGFVGKQGISGLAFEQGRRLSDVTGLAGGNDEA
jgi:hypothetical protein